MLCTKCSNDNPTDALFCEGCGAKLEPVCATCNASVSPGALFCKKCGTAISTAKPDARAGSHSPGSQIKVAADTGSAFEPVEGEHKTVTALFADIKGSTEMMEDLDPEEARAIIDPALKLMIDAVHRYDGYVVQSTGDGIFALFGAPVAHEDHPQRALYAALRLQDELERYSARLREGGNLPIEGRVGVNTGEVVVRLITTGAGQNEYTAIGHTFYQSGVADVQALAPTGSIAIRRADAQTRRGLFRAQAIGADEGQRGHRAGQRLRSGGAGAAAHTLAARRWAGVDQVRRARARDGSAQASAAEQAKSGRGQIVAAMAEPGVGKSRLLFEFKAVAQSDCLVLEASSVSHGKALAYRAGSRTPTPQVFSDRSGRRAAPAAPKVIGKLLELDRSLEDAVPYVFGLLGIHEGNDPFAQMDAQIRRRRTQDALKRILLRESLGRPLIVVFEDLHWIDSETQALLNLLADTIANARILLLVNYRPEYRHEWGHRTHYTQLRLDPLSAAGAEEMLEALLVSGFSLPRRPGSALADHGEGGDIGIPELKRLILDRTQGNPFFIEEIVQALFEEGVLVRNGALKVVRPPSQVHVPASVQGVLTSRIDRLPAEEKELLQTLAVIGREFPAGLVRAVTQRTEAALDGMLSHLQGAEFIYEQPAFPDVEYTFKHALTQEVAYNSVLVERRKLLHHRIAQAIESLFAERLDDHVKQLALHYSRSGDVLRAIEYLQRAGQQATSHAFFEEAVAQLHAALELLPKLDDASVRDSQELAIRMALLAPLNAINQVAAPEIQQNLHRTQILCEQFGQSQLLGMVLLNLFFVHWSISDFGVAKEYADQTLALAEHSTDEIVGFVAGFGAGFLSATTAEYSSARGYFQRALGISDETRSVLIRNPYIALGLLNCIGNLGYVLWILGYPDQAVGQHARQCQTLFLIPLGPVALNLGFIHILVTRCDFLRDHRGMREQAQRLVDLSQEHGLAYYSAVGLIWLGRLMVVEADVELGIETIAEGRRAFEVLGEVATSQLFSHCIATAYLAAGSTDEGLAFLEGAIAKAAAGGVRMYEADLHRLKGELLLEAGAPESQVEGSFREAIAIAQLQEAKGWELRATTSLARLLASRGRREEARILLGEIYRTGSPKASTPQTSKTPKPCSSGSARRKDLFERRR